MTSNEEVKRAVEALRDDIENCDCPAKYQKDQCEKCNARDAAIALATAKIEGRLISIEDKGEISDGYHTFNELYEHRCLLWINMCLMTPDTSYVVEEHFEGWFLLGNETPMGQISYHCPNRLLELVKDISRRKVEYDGHQSLDVIKRLTELASSMKVGKVGKINEERLIEIIKSCQIDIGHHRYTKYKDDKPFAIGDCCNVDIEDLVKAIITEIGQL